ncbi:MAG: Shikimate kinase [Bacteroidota bacterium]|jgi:shikimate kinase
MNTWYLWGYMGSGKSSVGRAVAQNLNLEFKDLDKIIIEESGMSISDFIRDRGELAFRKLERQLLLENEDFNGIFSCGGGTPCYYDNAEWMVSKGQAVYLRASPSWLHHRLASSRTRGIKRPQLTGVADQDLSEFIAKHLFERQHFYQMAQHKIAVDQNSKEQVIENLERLIKPNR